MVKLEDGSVVLASQLISGTGEDDNGKPVKFEKNEESIIPTYRAEADLNDGTGRKKVYSFDIADTPVRVSVSVVEPEKDKKPQVESESGDNNDNKTADLNKEKPLTVNDTTEARVIKTEVPPQQKHPSIMANKKDFP